MKLFKRFKRLFSIDVANCSIDDLKRNINASALVMFFIVISTTLIALFVMHKMYMDEKAEINNQKTISAINVYQSSMAEKLSVAASSASFLDYIRSGQKTRDSLFYHFATDMNRLKMNGIVGMRIIDSVNHKTIYSDGENSSSSITLKLCYLGDILDGKNGDCSYLWQLYFNMNDLMKEIKTINTDISQCKNCVPYSFLSSHYISSFPVADFSNMFLYMNVKEAGDFFFYLYLLLITIAFALFASWSWQRLSHLIHIYIAKPINDLTVCLGASETTSLNSSLVEIQFLIDEINSWKLRLSKAKEDENAEKISKVVAQFAHDVRSPLATINIIISEMQVAASGYMNILSSAVQRISDIANHFLELYKNPNAVSVNEVKITNINNVISSIIAEKQYQYRGKANIDLIVKEGSFDINALIDESDLQRMLSNLINNSVEACQDFSIITVQLIKLFDSFLIEISDNGSGIPADLIPKVMKGGVSIGKVGGSGMGLSHAVNKVREWYGELHIDSIVGKGTTITMKIPLA